MYHNPSILFKGIKTEFARLLAENPKSAVSNFIFEGVSEYNDSESYLYYDTAGGIKEWVDSVSLSDSKGFQYEIKNRDWYDGIRVDRNTIHDGRKTLGASLEQQLRNMLDNWITFPEILVGSLLTQNGNAFDGTAFFATTRPEVEGDDTINNLYTGTGATLDNITADLTGAIGALVGMRDKLGNPFNRNAKIAVYVPVHLKDKFELLATSQTLHDEGEATDNPLYKAFEVRVNYDQSADNDDWYVINENAKLKPFIFQSKKSPVWNMDDSPKNKFVDYFATARLNAGYGNPMAIVKVDNA